MLSGVRLACLPLLSVDRRALPIRFFPRPLAEPIRFETHLSAPRLTIPVSQSFPKNYVPELAITVLAISILFMPVGHSFQIQKIQAAPILAKPVRFHPFSADTIGSH